MKVSIWWVIFAFYVGLFGGIFITICCQRFKRNLTGGHF